MTKAVEFPIKEQGERNPCSDCKSNSMEECLLIKHCPYWVVKKEKSDEYLFNTGVTL